MPEVREHATRDRQDLVAVLDAHVHVHPVDEHLPAPPLRAVDECRVPLLVRDLLLRPPRERVRARAHELDPQGVGDLADLVDRALEVVARAPHGAVDARDDLDGVEEELLADVRVLAAARGLDGVEDGLRDLAEVARVLVDERELPLDADGRALGRRERQVHVSAPSRWRQGR